MIVMTFPRAVRLIEHTLIPLKDGTTLAARIWLPEDAEQNPVPAILEYLPYRKRDGTYERDALTHPYLAGHGYAGVRVDIRGSGESTGLLVDEYAKQEQDDGVELIAWLAAQPWCTGAVGMMGLSWGTRRTASPSIHRYLQCRRERRRSRDLRDRDESARLVRKSRRACDTGDTPGLRELDSAQHPPATRCGPPTSYRLSTVSTCAR